MNERLIENGLNPISLKTSNKLISEELYENEEFEVEYGSSGFKKHMRNHTFSEVSHLKAYGYNFSYFGPIDEDEVEQIRAAESHEIPLSQIIRFFQGCSTSLPQGMNIIEAEEIYTQWYEVQEQVEEDTEYGFFAKNPRRTNS